SFVARACRVPTNAGRSGLVEELPHRVVLAGLLPGLAVGDMEGHLGEQLPQLVPLDACALGQFSDLVHELVELVSQVDHTGDDSRLLLDDLRDLIFDDDRLLVLDLDLWLPLASVPRDVTAEAARRLEESTAVLLDVVMRDLVHALVDDAGVHQEECLAVLDRDLRLWRARVARDRGSTLRDGSAVYVPEVTLGLGLDLLHFLLPHLFLSVPVDTVLTVDLDAMLTFTLIRARVQFLELVEPESFRLRERVTLRSRTAGRVRECEHITLMRLCAVVSTLRDADIPADGLTSALECLRPTSFRSHLISSLHIGSGRA